MDCDMNRTAFLAGEAGENNLSPDNTRDIVAPPDPADPLPPPKPTRRRKKVVANPLQLPVGQAEEYEPIIRVLMTEPDEVLADATAQSRLAVALDNVGTNSLPVLIADDELKFSRLVEPLTMSNLLDHLDRFPALHNIVLGGSPQSVIEVAAGEWNGAISAKMATAQPTPAASDKQTAFNNDFLAALGSRHYLDLATIQSLREVHSTLELLQLLNRRRLGWFFDEICRLACLEVRKRLKQPATLETVAFGTTGAVLGRARVEPGTFQI